MIFFSICRKRRTQSAFKEKGGEFNSEITFPIIMFQVSIVMEVQNVRFMILLKEGVTLMYK